jgi:hypothetical protein
MIVSGRQQYVFDEKGTRYLDVRLCCRSDGYPPFCCLRQQHLVFWLNYVIYRALSAGAVSMSSLWPYFMCITIILLLQCLNAVLLLMPKGCAV